MAKTKIPSPKSPRLFAEISENFSQLQFDLGRQKYLVEYHQKNVNALLEQMARVDEEATARKNLDDEVAKSKKESEANPEQPK